MEGKPYHRDRFIAALLVRISVRKASSVRAAVAPEHAVLDRNTRTAPPRSLSGAVKLSAGIEDCLRELCVSSLVEIRLKKHAVTLTCKYRDACGSGGHPLAGKT